MVNDYHVFSIVSRREDLLSTLEVASSHYSEKLDYFSAIKKIKNQNVQLELLNKNLENLVHERTKRDFESSNRALKDLKSIQDLLRFIKQMARSENIEEILSTVRKEFKKFHGLRAPILLFPQSTSLLRVFYFQGKQFIERKLIVDGISFLFEDRDETEFRKDLSNLLGRPFGHVEWVKFSFTEKESDHPFAALLCEHSLSQKGLENFREYTRERWAIINLAIENVLLREGSQIIARQWARTFNEMQDPILIIDKNYNMTLANGQIRSVQTGVCYRDFAGRDSPCVDCPVIEAVKTGKAQSADIHCHGKVYRAHFLSNFSSGSGARYPCGQPICRYDINSRFAGEGYSR